jgi:hypothetical protein
VLVWCIFPVFVYVHIVPEKSEKGYGVGSSENCSKKYYQKRNSSTNLVDGRFLDEPGCVGGQDAVRGQGVDLVRAAFLQSVGRIDERLSKNYFNVFKYSKY